MEKSAQEIIELLIAKYPRRLSELYRSHGVYNKLPDVQTTMDMVVVYGDPFLMKLYDLYHQQTSSFLGLFGSAPGLGLKKKEKSVQDAQPIVAEERKDSVAKVTNTPAAEKKEKGKGWDKFKNLISDAISLGGSVKTGVEKNKEEKVREKQKEEDEKNEELILGMSKNVFYGFVVVIIIIIIIAVVNALNTEKGG